MLKAEVTSQLTGTPSTAATLAGAGSSHRPAMAWLSAALAAAVPLLGAHFAAHYYQAKRIQSLSERRVEPTSVGSKPRIAILPFENLSLDPANAFFADGLHEQIVATLSNRTPGLEVISRTTMMTYRNPKPVELIAKELGATHVLEGSVRREGDTVRLTLQLIDARTDDHIWSQDYDRTLRSALALESDVASEVAAQLSVRLAHRTDMLEQLARDPEFSAYAQGAALKNSCEC
jgi:TolB-like protein